MTDEQLFYLMIFTIAAATLLAWLVKLWRRRRFRHSALPDAWEQLYRLDPAEWQVHQ